MELLSHTCYQAVLAHDTRFDGLFFTCVKSTGIYCRPICRAIVPREENCSFVSSAVEAEKAGYRPCLRCRPEHAPANDKHRTSDLAHALANHIDETLLLDETLSGVARQFGLSERHLRRLFVAQFGLEPKRYLTTRRLLFAKQLLQDTSMPILQVAYASGFRTPARLTINMRQSYGFTPQRLRKEDKTNRKLEPILLRADYRPPFNWEALLQFIERRAAPGESIVDQAYHRRLGKHEIIVRNVPAKNHLTIQLPAELSRQACALLSQTRTLFDLDANPLVIEASLAQDPTLAPLIARYPGLRVPGCWDAFEVLLRTVVGQQVSVGGASTLLRRLAERFNLATPDALAKSTPAMIAAVGFPLKRATALWQLSKLVRSGKIRLGERDPRQFYDQLVAVPGVGPWTAEYLCMRVLHWPDAFPASDLGLQKAVVPGQRQSARQLISRATSWQPWRSYATMLLWQTLANQEG